MSSLLFYLVGIFVRILDFLLPKAKRRFVYLSDPDVADNPLALWLCQTAMRPDIDSVWLVRGDIEAARRRLASALGQGEVTRVTVLRKNSLNGFMAVLTSRVLILSHASYRFLHSSSGRLSVNLWHGMPLKRVGLLDGKDVKLLGAITHSVATSDRFVTLTARCFGIPERDVWKLGLPRADLMWSPSANQLASILSPAGRKLCVYMPTYRHAYSGDIRSDTNLAKGQLPMLEGKLEQLDSELRGSGWHLVIKLHPMDHLNSRLWPPYSCITVLTHAAFRELGYDVYALVGASSKLITDFSSVFVDYLALRRPLAFAISPDEDYSRGITMEGPIDGLLPGPILGHYDDVVRFILSDQFDFEAYRERAYAMQEFYDSGSATRVLSEICKRL